MQEESEPLRSKLDSDFFDATYNFLHKSNTEILGDEAKRDSRINIVISFIIILLNEDLVKISPTAEAPIFGVSLTADSESNVSEILFAIAIYYLASFLLKSYSDWVNYSMIVRLAMIQLSNYEERLPTSNQVRAYEETYEGTRLSIDRAWIEDDPAALSENINLYRNNRIKHHQKLYSDIKKIKWSQPNLTKTQYSRYARSAVQLIFPLSISLYSLFSFP